MSRRRARAHAFAKQARADMEADRVLDSDPDLPRCQSLHFLQMACEKRCKAHLCFSGANPEALAPSHAHVASVLPKIFRMTYSDTKGVALKRPSTHLQQIGHIARQIELLSPSVRAGGRRPDNCEYPWEGPDSDQNGEKLVHTPAEYEFVTLDFLNQPSGRTLIKFLGTAIGNLLPQAS